MKPNTIELDKDGIFCYEAPEIDTCYPKDCIEETPVHFLKSENRYVCACRIKEVETFEAAKRDGVYFKPEHELHSIQCIRRSMSGSIDVFKLEQGKPYPIPDGYEVKIEKDNCDCNLPDATNDMCKYPECLYAILVPKEKVVVDYEYCEEFNKKPCPLEAHGDICTCMLASSLDVASNLIGEPKQQSIEEAALIAFPKEDLSKYSNATDLSGLYRDGFIVGAKSQAAKEYWYEQFKQEKP